MSGNYQTLKWQETLNSFTIDCQLKIATHPAESGVVLLIIPGVDGSVDGYENKYMRIAESIQEQYSAAVVRMENPFITSSHWESNIRRVLEFISDNAVSLAGTKNIELRIMAHSAGAAVIGQIAWEYPHISRLLLINPATRLDQAGMCVGLTEFKGKTTILVGSNDPSAALSSNATLNDTALNIDIITVDGADHNFAGEAFPAFLKSPSKYLF